MTNIDHSTLAAYVDGELDSELADAVESHLRTNPNAQAFVDQMRELNGLTKMAHNAPMHDQPPQMLLNTILKASVTPKPSPAPTLSTSLSQWRLMVPLAAGLAGLLIGGFASISYIDYSTQKALRAEAASITLDEQAMDSVLNQVLEMNVSGKSQTWHNPDSGRSAELTPVRTYQKEDKTYCREYKKKVRHMGQADVTYGIACRDSDGLWRTQYLIQDLRTDKSL